MFYAFYAWWDYLIKCLSERGVLESVGLRNQRPLKACARMLSERGLGLVVHWHFPLGYVAKINAP